MVRIIAIGGGEIGRPGYDIETKDIDLRAISLTGKRNPKLLFIPTASNDSASYCTVIKSYYGDNLGCTVDNLLLIDPKLSKKEICEKVFNSDMIYIGGGDPQRLMDVWKNIGFENILVEAIKKNIVVFGISAGAICLFEKGFIPPKKFSTKKWEIVEGFGLIKGMVAPHYNDKKVQEKLDEFILKNKSECLGLEDCTAFEINGSHASVIKSSDKSNIYLLKFDNQFRKINLQGSIGLYFNFDKFN